ncbi:protein COBRA precursor [Dorcoceras hygrometricum]|uniref:Protein COBRA n=1 Tax=Dorcoceras hygrometricum TaxID=472368 RepID=A0A2Z7D2I3_9LAMI|nr:protein COBRA precursor [Dorcoceras hygrometricum]
MQSNHTGAMKEKSSGQEVLDGSDIMKLVENERVFGKFVDHKFQELDADGDGKLSVKELQPAVADIGAALGLPAQGTSADSDNIYTEVLNEFTGGKHKKVNKTKFKAVLSDILVGMAAGLKRDPVVILRIDGEDLRAFVAGPTFEPEMISIFSEIDLPNGSLKDYIINAFEKLSIDHGMPPSTDHWVMCDIVEPALQSLGGLFEQPVSQETFLAAFQRSTEAVSRILKERPAIVAHSQNAFDGSGIRSLMSNKFELDKALDLAIKSIPNDRSGKFSKDFLNVALDALSTSAGLPPFGAIQEVDDIIVEALKMFNASDGKTVKEDEFKKILREVLGSIMLQLEGKLFLQARVTIQNYYQYRHVGSPGWRLGWIWAKNEVILSMSGAFAIEKGNCSKFNQAPHSCKPDPVISDLMPDSPDSTTQNRPDGCCRGGILTAWAIDPSISYSSFELTVGNLEQNTTGYKPQNLTLMAPGLGYTCGPVMETSPTHYSSNGGRRDEQVSRTWKSKCTYSSYLAYTTPMCCVSLSTFYNPTITDCPSCSCGCKEANGNATSCVSITAKSWSKQMKHCLVPSKGSGHTTKVQASNFVRVYLCLSSRERMVTSDLLGTDIVQCTNHMCPIRIHWHIKNNYQDHWRVKLTVSNYNYGRNFSDWNVLVQHPGFGLPASVYSFNSTTLSTIGVPEDVALFWGKEDYNTELLQADEHQLGSVTTEILLQKDSTSFTLTNGWGFPRRMYINGENCQMPPPDTFPMLPNGSPRRKPFHVQLPHLLAVLYLIYGTLFMF